MTMRREFEALLHKLEDEQHKLLESVAIQGVLPSNGTLSRVAQLELNIAALENTLDRLEKKSQRNSKL